MSTELFLSIALLRIHWGYSIRVFPGSTAQHSYLVPPPTTIIGAIAYHYNRFFEVYERGDVYLSPMKLVEDFWPVYASTAFLNLEIPLPRTLQMIKYLSAPYRAFVDVGACYERVSLGEVRSPIGVGYVVAPAQQMMIAIASLKPIPKEILWSIVRLGSKESLVAVERVDVRKVRASRLRAGDRIDDVNTYVLRSLVQRYVATYVYEESIPFPITLDEWRWVYSYRAKVGRPPVLREVIVPLPKLEEVVLAGDALLVEVEDPYLRMLMPRTVFP